MNACAVAGGGNSGGLRFIKLCGFLFLLCLYSVFFSLQEKRFSENTLNLSHPLPPAIQKIALGYMHQLGGEMQFIKASVFYGGIKPGRDPLTYAAPMAMHFNAAASLHPHFIDTYFLCNAILPYINKDYVREANAILALGMTALPDSWIIPFFVGFNHFYHLDEPLEAARLFRLAAKKPQGPVMLEHLASILSAEGGNIYAALISLRGMYTNEKDEGIKRRYAEEIAAFEKAVTVLEAIRHHEKMKGALPAALTDLVPEYLPTIPDIGPFFALEWQPPHLQVVRVAKKKNPRR